MKKLVLVFLLCLAACRPVKDNCQEGAHRCSPRGEPQECSGGWWHNGDRPCNQNALPDGSVPVCCETNSAYAGRVLHACVPQILCIQYSDAGTGDVE